MKPPLVSVITPSYNQGRFIEQTIQSILGQDYPNIEYMVIDGGSTDNTIEIIRKYEQKLHWISEPDRGQTDAINKGFRKSKGEILCWLNSDDTYEPGAISKAVEYFLEHPDVMMVYGEGNEIDENGVLLQRFPATQNFDLWKLIHVWDYILQPTTFFKKDIFDKIELPDINLNWCMDWDLWIRIGCHYKIAYINYVFANSRLYSETKTDSGGLKRLNEIVSIMRKYGRRKYPLGYFLYGEDTIETLVRQNSRIIFIILHKLFNISRIILIKVLKNYQGVYEDKWLGKKARLMMPVPESTKALEFVMEFPMLSHSVFPNVLEIRANGTKMIEHKINNPGKSSIKMELDSHQNGLIEVELIFNKAFKPKKETRKLSGLLYDINYIS